MAFEPRAGLGARKPHRPHPAAPDAVGHGDRRSTGVASGKPLARDEGLVMLCIRVAPSLRRRLKLAAAGSGRPVQALAADALEAVCKQYDM
jgi:hypothetical protein